LVAEVPPKGAIRNSGNRILHLAVENDTATEARIIFEDTVFEVSLGILADVKETVIPSRVVLENYSLEIKQLYLRFRLLIGWVCF
jgi:hypothetical protein